MTTKEDEPKLTPEVSGELPEWEEISPGVYARDIPEGQRGVSRSTCLKLAQQAGDSATRLVLRLTAKRARLP